jgi:hypothetical protein
MGKRKVVNEQLRLAVFLLEFRKSVFSVARGRSIRELPRLRKFYGKGSWRKRKGFANVRLPDGRIRRAELHW